MRLPASTGGGMAPALKEVAAMAASDTPVLGGTSSTSCSCCSIISSGISASMLASGSRRGGSLGCKGCCSCCC